MPLRLVDETARGPAGLRVDHSKVPTIREQVEAGHVKVAVVSLFLALSSYLSNQFILSFRLLPPEVLG